MKTQFAIVAFFLSYNDAHLRGWYSGKESPTNQAMKRLVAATDRQ